MRTRCDLRPAISDKNRAIVIDYFIELGITLNLFDETVTYSITIFDRYCETLSVRIPRDEIQFISNVCLIIGIKFNEISINMNNSIDRIIENKLEFISKEIEVLNSINFYIFLKFKIPPKIPEKYFLILNTLLIDREYTAPFECVHLHNLEILKELKLINSNYPNLKNILRI